MSDYYVNFDKEENNNLIFIDHLHANLLSEQTMVVTFWLKLTSKPTAEGSLEEKQYVEYYYDGTSGWYICLESNLENSNYMDLRVFMKFAEGDVFDNTFEYISPNIGFWQHFVIYFNQGGDVNVWINGIKHYQFYSMDEGTINCSSFFYIGQDALASVEGRMDASLDSFGIFKDLTISSVNTLVSYYYNKGFGRKIKNDDNGVVFALNFDEGQGGTTNDVVNGFVGVFSDEYEETGLWSVGGIRDILDTSDIKVYLTSLEPYMEQTNYAQSVGGYISNSLLYPETTLEEDVSLYDVSLELIVPEEGNFNNWQNIEYLNIGQELIKVEPITSKHVVVGSRAANNLTESHSLGSVVKGIVTKNIFNNSFNSDYKQYRCYAVKNISAVASAYDFQIYFKQKTLNESANVSVAIEIPKNQQIEEETSSWSSSMFVSNSLAGRYADNYFINCYIIINSGPNNGETRRISSFDGVTGTFVFYDSLAIDYDATLYSSSIEYIIDTSPSQRLKSGTISPINSDYLTSFEEASEAIPKIVELSGNQFNPGDVFYIWVEREIRQGEKRYNDDSFVLCVKYNKEQ